MSTTTFTVSSTIGGANIVIGANASGTTMLANPASYLYICTDAYNATAVNLDVTQANTTGNILVAVTNNIVVNAPIIFGGNLDTANTNLVANTVYYVKTIDSPTGTANIIVSKSRTNGVAGTAVTISANSTLATANAICYVGSDIWRRVNLNSW